VKKSVSNKSVVLQLPWRHWWS